jgi:hypothetical protein
MSVGRAGMYNLHCDWNRESVCGWNRGSAESEVEEECDDHSDRKESANQAMYERR